MLATHPALMSAVLGDGASPWSFRTLFANGEAGGVYDPSDLTAEKVAWALANPGFTSAQFLAAFPTHGLYQDAAGTTPVTALGQPVGLALDQSRGFALGAEICPNGSFANATGWTLTTGASISGGKLVFSAAASQNPNAYIALTGAANGDVYSITFTISDYVSGQVAVRLYTSGSTSALFGANGTYTVLLAVPASNGNFGFVTTGASTTLSISNLSVKKVLGVHAIQPTNSSRPLLDGRVNLLTRTEEFDNAAWTKTNATVTANATTAPDGTTTADTVAWTTSGSTLLQSVTVISGASYTFSIYMRVASGTRTVDIGNINSGVWSTVTVTTDWQRFTVTQTASAATRFPGLQSGISGGGANVFIWGADLRLAADAAYPYQRVAAATDYADVGVPRSFLFDGFDDSLYTASNMDFATVTSDSLARRNLLLVPSQFDDASWTKSNSTISANATTSPDGTTTADLMYPTTTGTLRWVFQATTLASAVYTRSVFAKAQNKSILYIDPLGTGVAFAYFNLTNGTVGTVSAGYTASITAAGNGFYRCTMTNVSAGATNFGGVYGVADADGSTSVTANGTDGIFLWGAQIEVGATATAFQNIGTDKVTVLAGVLKSSDTFGLAAELSTSVAADNGSFYMGPPGVVGKFGFGSRGTTLREAQGDMLVGSTRVATGIGDIAAPNVVLRLNQTAVASTASQGTGNYGNYRLNIGRRNNLSSPFNGKIYQLIVRGALTDAATLAQAERYVGARTGIFL